MGPSSDLRFVQSCVTVSGLGHNDESQLSVNPDDFSTMNYTQLLRQNDQNKFIVSF